jgi:hypothetical protein
MFGFSKLTYDVTIPSFSILNGFLMELFSECSVKVSALKLGIGEQAASSIFILTFIFFEATPPIYFSY